MSIIYEALKKVEKEKDKLSGKENRKEALLAPLVTGVSCLLILGFLYFKGNSFFLPIELKDLAGGRNKSYLEKKDLINQYMLEGIVYDQKVASCVINGRVLKEEDKIDDLKIVRINPATVELFNLRDNTNLILSFSKNTYLKHNK